MKAKVRCIVTSMFIFVCTQNYAQTTDSLARYPHFIGVNTTIFVKNFLSISSSSVVFNDPYVLVYKYVGKRGGALRTGVGFNFINTVNSSNGNIGLTPDSSVYGLYFRMGYEKQLPLAKTFNIYFGADGRYEQKRTRIETQVVSTPAGQVSSKTTSSGRWGMGLVAGVEYKLHKRISLMAEASTIMYYEEIHKRIEDNRFPSLNSNEFTAQQFLEFSFPTSIYFIIKL